jgi:hypothetical protein
MATKPQREFPRINFVALLAATLFLVSVFLYWWGIDVSSPFVSESSRWSLWSGPSTIYVGPKNSAQTLTTYSPIIGILVIASAVLLLLGVIPKASRLLIGSAVLAVVALILYPIIVNAAVSNACSGIPICISGPFGTHSSTEGTLTTTLTWGFQSGFYLEFVGVILSVIAIAFQRTYLPSKTPRT